MTEEQQKYRERLVQVRSSLREIDETIAGLKKEEKELFKLIVPVKERCQACTGTGKVERMDPASKSYYETKCPQCDGIGQIEEKF